MALKGRQYTVTAVAVAPLALPADGVATDAQPGHIPIKEIHFKTPVGNTGIVNIGNSNVTTTANALVILDGDQSWSSGPHSDQANLYADDFYVIGTANDVVHIIVVPY